MSDKTDEKTTYEDELLTLFRQLSNAEKQRIISRVRGIKNLPAAPSGREFLERTAHIQIPTDELDQMEKVIEDDFGRVDDLPPGISGKKAIEIVTSLNIPSAAIDEIEQAIQQARDESRDFPDVDFDN